MLVVNLKPSRQQRIYFIDVNHFVEVGVLSSLAVIYIIKKASKQLVHMRLLERLILRKILECYNFQTLWLTERTTRSKTFGFGRKFNIANTSSVIFRLFSTTYAAVLSGFSRESRDDYGLCFEHQNCNLDTSEVIFYQV